MSAARGRPARPPLTAMRPAAVSRRAPSPLADAWAMPKSRSAQKQGLTSASVLSQRPNVPVGQPGARKGRDGPELPLDRVGIDAVLGELFAKRVAIDAEYLRSAQLVAAGLAEHSAKQGLFHESDDQVVEVGAVELTKAADALHQLALDDLLQRAVHARRCGGRHGPDRQVLGQDHAGGGQDHGPLDDVLQLPD